MFWFPFGIVLSFYQATERSRGTKLSDRPESSNKHILLVTGIAVVCFSITFTPVIVICMGDKQFRQQNLNIRCTKIQPENEAAAPVSEMVTIQRSEERRDALDDPVV